MTLTEFERQTLAYVLFVLRRCAEKDADAADDVRVRLDDSLSGDEFAALWQLGLRLMDMRPCVVCDQPPETTCRDCCCKEE